MKTRINYICILVVFGVISACSTASPTPAPQEATPVSRPTVIVVITNPPTPEPTPETGFGGSILYDDGANILSVNPNTGEAEVFLSREELESNLAKDRSADSYTYGEKKPIAVSFSPDLSKALVTICADLDARYRCLFSSFVYSLDSETGAKLPVPPGAYGVYWQWSPDGSKLAGAAWSYDRTLYFPTAFYVVDSDGANLALLAPVVNDRWQFAWSPDGTAVYPLSFAANFQSFFMDETESKEIALSGLDPSESIECLAFSPDGSRVVFTVRYASRRNHERVYIADFDFLQVTPMTEYDIDFRYFCKAAWSPDGRFVHLRYEYDTRAETGEEVKGVEPRRDKIVAVETSALLETPKDLLICGWTPDNYLIYETKTADGGIQIRTPGNDEPVNASAGLQSTVLHCPVDWLAKP